MVGRGDGTLTFDMGLIEEERANVAGGEAAGGELLRMRNDSDVRSSTGPGLAS